MAIREDIGSIMHLACGLALPAAAGTLGYVSGLDQGSSAMIGVTTAGLVSAAGGIWGNLYADAHQRKRDKAEAERGRIFNHDLARAVAQSIATLLEPLTEDERFSKESRGAIATLCKQSERLWLSMADDGNPVFAPLLEDELAEAVTVDPENPKLGSYGTRQMWSQVIKAMSKEAGGTVSENLASKTPAFAEATRVCHEGFA